MTFMKYYQLITFLCIFIGFQTSAIGQTGTIRIEVKGIKTIEGDIVAALFSNADDEMAVADL